MITIAGRKIGEKHPVFVIAEAGINHNGDMDKAKQLIDAAAKAEADCVKFQTHMPKHQMLKETKSADYIGGDIYKLLEKVELSKEQHLELKKYAESKGLIFMSTPFSKQGFDLIEDIVPAFKIGSGELTNLPLQEHVARKGKPMLISTGMSTLEEVERTVKLVTGINKDVVLLQCTSSYPTPYKDVNLGMIPVLREKFKLPVGMSDHSIGIYTALGAVALGAVLVEKHFTIDRNWPGPDQKASIEPNELVDLVKGARAIKQALGAKKEIFGDEKQVRDMAAESVVSIVDIAKGTVIAKDMVWVKRPGTGIPAHKLQEVIGKKAAKDIKADTLIRWEDLS